MSTFSQHRLHHIGILVPDVAASSTQYKHAFGYEEVTAVIHDPVQAAFVKFLKLPGSDHFVELIAPDTPASHLQKALQRSTAVHHFCLISDDLDASLNNARNNSWLTLSNPVPSVAFRGKKIAWLMNRERALVELVESPADLLIE